MRDKLITAGLVITLLGWLANSLYEAMSDRISDNQESINALIHLHLNGK